MITFARILQETGTQCNGLLLSPAPKHLILGQPLFLFVSRFNAHIMYRGILLCSRTARYSCNNVKWGVWSCMIGLHLKLSGWIGPDDRICHLHAWHLGCGQHGGWLMWQLPDQTIHSLLLSSDQALPPLLCVRFRESTPARMYWQKHDLANTDANLVSENISTAWVDPGIHPQTRLQID